MNVSQACTMLRVITVLTAWTAMNPALAADDASVCGQETSRQERQLAIPDHLLRAISLVESGRWDPERRENSAWPWTVNAEGEGRFLPNKQAAIAEVASLRRRGVRNIDVGCMQVNLLAHPDAFASLDEAFDPRSNVAYASRFLLELYGQDGSWPTAAAHYHSQTPELAAPYRARLLASWDKLRQQPKPNATLQVVALDDGPRLALGVSFPVEPSAAPQPPAGTDPLGRSEAERAAAKQAADSYRQAKIAEYRQKHGLSAGG